MLSVYNLFFDISFYRKAADRNRATIALVTLLLLFAFFSAYALLVPFRTAANMEAQTYLYRALRPVEYPLFAGAFSAFYVMFVVAIAGIRLGYLRYVVLLPTLMIYISTVSIALQSNIALAQNAYLLVVALIVAGLLDGERGLLIFMPIHFAVLIVGFLTGDTDRLSALQPNTWQGLTLLTITSTAIIIFLFLYHRTVVTETSELELSSSRRRLQLAQLTTRIAHSISEVDDLDVILSQIVDEINADYEAMYHVQIFLIDDTGRIAQLAASTGSAGRMLLERKHSLPVGSLSVIGQATQRQEPIVAVVGGEDSVHRPNDLLPDTRLEVALPLNAGNRNIGALDLQSRYTDVLEDGDLTSLQAIADSIAITIDNARLLAQTRERLQENQQLVERMTENRQEIERLNRELTGAIWAEYLTKQRMDHNFDLDFREDRMMNSHHFTQSIVEALNRGEVIRREEGDGYVVAIPLRVRGEVIGAMEFEVNDDLSQEDLDMLGEVGERFGLAAENNRLYENSQRTAQREALVNEIGTRIQSANSVEATMAEAMRSLSDALKAKRVSIQLGKPST
ncbi:MAG: GAF domain-containing protein [Chloroflexota bacterium]